MGEMLREETERYSELGPDSDSFIPGDAEPGGTFVIAYMDGEPVGCGALRRIDQSAAEVKRMYVAPNVRRRGIGGAILMELERLAFGFGYRVIRVETGNRQPEAIALYERRGFHRIPPFGEHVGDPVSICFEKELALQVQCHEDLSIRDTRGEELVQIREMEQSEAMAFIIPYSLERHQAEFAKPDVLYKSVRRGEELVGFVILALDADGRSVEFRRIVISTPGCGYGKRVVRMVGELCRNELGRSRVWLDVFETNHRARHVYVQCGYERFGHSEHEGRKLLLYEKPV